MTDHSPLAERFGAVAHTLVPALDDVERFDNPARGTRGRAMLVVQPATLDEVRAVVGVARATRTRLIPQGANTGLVGGSVAPADEPSVVVSTERLDAVVDIDATDATATVSAGVHLSTLNEAAHEAGLHLPIDLSADPCLGGMVATNTGGSRALRYGPMRRHVLGVQVVAADGDRSVYGGLTGLRKDSRGFDITQFVVGSGGAMGLVTAATVALTRIPRSTTTWWLALDEPRRLIDLLTFLDTRRPSTLSAFEYVSTNAMRLTLSAPGAPPSPFGSSLPAAAVLAEWSFNGESGYPDDDTSTGIESDIAAAYDRGLLTDGRLVAPEPGWALRHRVSDSLKAHGVVLGHDVSVPRRSLMTLRDRAVAAVGAVSADVMMCDFGHAGDGGLHLNVLVPATAGPPSAELAGAIRGCIDDVVAELGGSYSAEHGLGPLNAARWLAVTPALEQRMVASVKAVVDPERLLGHPRHPYNQLGGLRRSVTSC